MITPSKEFWEIFKSTPGALSTTEAIAIMNIAAQAPKGIFLELGSHKGKSSQCIALIVSFLKEEGTFIAVEPEFTDENWKQPFVGTISRMLPESGFGWWSKYSTEMIHEYDELSFCFVDSGTHSDDLVMNETKMLDDRMISGGIIAYHDCFSQFTKVTEAYEYLLSTGKYEPIEINWQEIFDYVAEHNLEEGNNSWHQYPELPHPPNFVGALRRK
jgi:hypothetical protein